MATVLIKLIFPDGKQDSYTYFNVNLKKSFLNKNDAALYIVDGIGTTERTILFNWDYVYKFEVQERKEETDDAEN